MIKRLLTCLFLIGCGSSGYNVEAEPPKVVTWQCYCGKEHIKLFPNYLLRLDFGVTRVQLEQALSNRKLKFTYIHQVHEEMDFSSSGGKKYGALLGYFIEIEDIKTLDELPGVDLVVGNRLVLTIPTADTEKQ